LVSLEREGTCIRVSSIVRRRLNLLKGFWELRSIDAVIKEMLEVFDEDIKQALVKLQEDFERQRS